MTLRRRRSDRTPAALAPRYSEPAGARERSSTLAARAAGLSLGALVLCASGLAQASHPPRMPLVQHVLAHPTDPSRVAVGTRYGGYYVTSDGGTNWAQVCTAALGVEDTESYPGVFTATGTLVVSTGYGGIARSGDACSWASWTPPGPSFIADLIEPSSSTLLALNSASGGASFVNQIWISRDGAESWSELGVPLPSDVPLVALDAYANTNDLYVTALGPRGPELISSHDAGQTWQRSLIAEGSPAEPRWIAVSNLQPERVALILRHDRADESAPPDRLLLSNDSGQTWAVVHEAAPGPLFAALSADDVLFYGGPNDGLWQLPLQGTGAVTTRISDTPTLGLTWQSGTLWSAADELTNDYSLAASADDGVSFEPRFALCEGYGALECAADSSVRLACGGDIETGPWQPLGDTCGGNVQTPTEGIPSAPGTSRTAELRGTLCSLGTTPASAKPAFPWLMGAAAFLVLRRVRRARQGRFEMR